MEKTKHTIGLLICNPVDNKLLKRFLEEMNNEVIQLSDGLTSSGYEKKLSLIIADEINGRNHFQELLILKNEAAPLLLPIIILCNKTMDHLSLMKKGFNEVLKLPLTKEQLSTKVDLLLRLREDSENQYRIIFDNINVGIYRMTLEHKLIQANSAFIHLLGFENISELKNKSLTDAGILSKTERACFLKVLKKEKSVVNFETIWTSRKGNEIYVRENAILFHDKESNLFYYHGVIEDVTKQRKIEEALLDSEKKFDQLTKHSPYGILIEVENKIVSVNKSLLNILHTNDANKIIGRNFLEIVHPDFHSIVIQRAKLAVNKQQLGQLMQEKLLDINGNIIDVEVITCPFTYNGKPAIQRIINDISEMVQKDKQNIFLTYYDQLTGLPNRLKIKEKINEILMLSKSEGSYFGLLFIDIDEFKKLNLKYNENESNKVLQDIAIRLQACAKQEDLVGFLGTDQFIMLIKNVIKPSEELILLAEEILKKLSEPFLANDKNLSISASIGISIYPINGEKSESLFTNADIAMNSAKLRAKNSYQFASSDLTNQFYTKSSLEDALRIAVTNKEFELFYQPKLCLATGSVSGVEALLRWEHPNEGYIPPDQFIPIAEETGLIMPLTKSVLELGFKQINLWRLNKFPLFRLALNLSVPTIQNNEIITMIDKLLDHYQLNPNTLEFEITESKLMLDIQRNLPILKKFKDYGIRVSIDDFGTGYSSLNYLKNIPFDTLKIDKSFINNIHLNHNDASIVSAIIEMAHSLQIKVVAEGVENEDQLNFLKEIKCDEIQGYYFCKPLSASGFTSFLKNFYEERV